MYVSITGLRLKAIHHAPQFWWHAFRSMRQALAAEGNISAEARTIDGVHHTLSAWVDENSMRAFLVIGGHLAAMKAFRHIATGKTIGFSADTLPDWQAAHAVSMARGKEA